MLQMQNGNNVAVKRTSTLNRIGECAYGDVHTITQEANVTQNFSLSKCASVHNC